MTHRRWLNIIAVFLLVTFATMSAAIYVGVGMVRRPDYAAHISDPSIVMQEKAFVVHDQHCAILIDGDSTALSGIDPRIIGEQTGMSACSIASARPIWDAAGTLPLDTYLAHNQKPRLLLLQFGPEMFYRANNRARLRSFSAYTMLLRQGSPQLALRTVLLHPTQTVRTFQMVYKLELASRTSAEAARKRNLSFQKALAEYNESGGRLDLGLPALTACDLPAQELNGPLDPKWIGYLRHRYEALGIITLIDAAPLPDCDPQLAKFQRDVAPYVDANTTAEPIGIFVHGDRHMTLEGARDHSVVLSRQIQAALASRAEVTQENRRAR